MLQLSSLCLMARHRLVSNVITDRRVKFHSASHGLRCLSHKLDTWLATSASVMNSPWKPYGTLCGSMMRASGCEDMVLAL